MIPLHSEQECEDYFRAVVPAGPFCYLDTSHPSGGIKRVRVGPLPLSMLYRHYGIGQPEGFSMDYSTCPPDGCDWP